MKSTFKLIRKTYEMAGAHERKTVLQNFASLSVLQAVTYALPIIILPYLFRVIGPAKFGLISFAQAFVQYFIIITDYGFNISATKEISLCASDTEKINSVYRSVMTIKLLLSLLCACFLLLFVLFIPKFRSDWMVYVLSFGVVFGSILFPLWYFQGIEKMKYIAYLNIIGGIAFTMAIVLLVHQPEHFLRVPMIHSTVFICIGVAGQWIAFRKMGVKISLPSKVELLRDLRNGWHVFISNVAINAYTTTRIFAVGLLTNNTLTGFYAIADKIAMLCQTFPLSSFTQALFPRLSHIYQSSRQRAFMFMQQIQTITVSFSFFFIPLIFIFAHPIVRLICGGSYAEVALALRFLLMAVFFVSANAFRVQFLLVCGEMHTYARIHVIAALLGMPLIFAFIELFSYVGAAIATILIEAGIYTATVAVLKRLKLDHSKEGR